MSSLDHRKLSPSQIPKGWSNDPNRLSDVKVMFTPGDYGLSSDITPVLAEKAKPQFLFESQDQYYLWNALSETVVRIEQPVGLAELLGCIDKAEWSEIKVVDVLRT